MHVKSATRLRVVDGAKYLVPFTSEFGDWRDPQAVKRHGVALRRKGCPPVAVQDVRQLLSILAVRYGPLPDDPTEAHRLVRQAVEYLLDKQDKRVPIERRTRWPKWGRGLR